MRSTKGEEPDQRRLVVLFVDDEEPFLRVMRTTLEDRFDVETANNAEEADLMMALKAFDVIVCDHMLPGEQGLDFLIRMKGRHPGTRRFLLTGYVNPEFLSRSRGLAGLSDCIVKPATPLELAKAIEQSLVGLST